MMEDIYLILFIQRKMLALFKNIGTLTLLLIAFPFNLLVVLLSLLWSWMSRTGILPVANRRTDVSSVPSQKNILITGAKMTKCLQLARLFHKAGHQVFLIETHKYWLSGNRFSQAVKGFYTVPAPKKNPEAYCQEILNIVKGEKIDIFIPVSSAVVSYYDSLAKQLISQEGINCECINFDPEITELLDNKFTFIEKVRELGLSAPKSFLITEPEQVLNFYFAADGSQYILKSIPYDSVRRLDLTKLPLASREEMEKFVNGLPISKEKPWIMQEFIKGKEYCTHSTVRKGIVRLHCCSSSSPFQVNYEQVDNPEILQWVKEFVKALNLTGQMSFDFIQAEDGKVYPVECNPRTHSAITMFHDHPGVADAYLKDAKDENEPAIEPLQNSKPTYWLYHELWRLTEIRSWGQLKGWINKMVKGTDAMFEVEDPLPFLMVHHWQIALLLLDNLRKLKGWVMIDFNIGKLIEIGED